MTFTYAGQVAKVNPISSLKIETQNRVLKAVPVQPMVRVNGGAGSYKMPLSRGSNLVMNSVARNSNKFVMSSTSLNSKVSTPVRPVSGNNYSNVARSFVIPAPSLTPKI
jgi:hypothetical protein